MKNLEKLSLLQFEQLSPAEEALLIGGSGGSWSGKTGMFAENGNTVVYINNMCMGALTLNSSGDWALAGGMSNHGMSGKITLSNNGWSINVMYGSSGLGGGPYYGSSGYGFSGGYTYGNYGLSGHVGSSGLGFSGTYTGGSFSLSGYVNGSGFGVGVTIPF